MECACITRQFLAPSGMRQVPPWDLSSLVKRTELSSVASLLQERDLYNWRSRRFRIFSAMSSTPPCKSPLFKRNQSIFSNLRPDSFILNNDGYTVERLIHGMEASYNKVPIWSYSKLCETFGPSFPTRYYRIETGDELEKLIADPTFNAADCTQVGRHFSWNLAITRMLIVVGGGIDPRQARCPTGSENGHCGCWGIQQETIGRVISAVFPDIANWSSHIARRFTSIHCYTCSLIGLSSAMVSMRRCSAISVALKTVIMSSVPELNFCPHYRLAVDPWKVLLATLPTYSSCCVISFLEHCPKEATCICFKIYKNAIINCVMLMNRYIMKLSWCIYTCYSPSRLSLAFRKFPFHPFKQRCHCTKLSTPPHLRGQKKIPLLPE